MRKFLIPLLIVPILAAGAAKSTQSRLFDKKLPNDKKVLHALNRLTFGPRAGDIEAVRKMGLKRWIDLQLNPSRIQENPELLAKLKPLDTLQMSTRVMIEHYPTQQILNAMARGTGAGELISKDPELRAFYRRIFARHPKKVAARKAIVAVARKLTTRMYAVLKQQRPYLIRPDSSIAPLTTEETVGPRERLDAAQSDQP